MVKIYSTTLNKINTMTEVVYQSECSYLWWFFTECTEKLQWHESWLSVPTR